MAGYVEEQLKRMADHLGVLNDEVGDIQVSVAGIQVDVKWLKHGFRWLMGLVATILVCGIAYAIFNGGS